MTILGWAIAASYLDPALFAYADPGSGMLLWQLLTAAALGLLFYAKTIVRKLRLLLGPGKAKANESSSEPGSR